MRTAGIIAAISVCLAAAGAAQGQATLTWVGDAGNNNWDIGTTANWTTNGVDRVNYADGDHVIFDDTAGGTTVWMTVSTNPGSVTVDSDALNYNFAAVGGGSHGIISWMGTFDLVKRGSGTLNIRYMGDCSDWDGNARFEEGAVISSFKSCSGALADADIILAGGEWIAHAYDDEHGDQSIYVESNSTMTKMTNTDAFPNSVDPMANGPLGGAPGAVLTVDGQPFGFSSPGAGARRDGVWNVNMVDNALNSIAVASTGVNRPLAHAAGYRR